MKAHKNFAIASAVCMAAAFQTGYKRNMKAHTYFGIAALGCMAVSLYTGYKILKPKANKQ